MSDTYTSLAEEFDVPVENVLSTLFLAGDTPVDTPLDKSQADGVREIWNIGASFEKTSRSAG